MEDTSNWEFAATVAAVSIGLGGLVLFTLIAIVGSWRMYGQASVAATEAAKANEAVRDLARQLERLQQAQIAATAQPAIAQADLQAAAAELADLRSQADALIAQQTRLQDAVRNLVEAGVLRAEGEPDEHLLALEASVKRLEENLGRVAAAIANFGQRPQ